MYHKLEVISPVIQSIRYYEDSKREDKIWDWKAKECDTGKIVDFRTSEMYRAYGPKVYVMKQCVKEKCDENNES